MLNKSGLDQPLVSMCIPVFNHERFVEHSIKSIIQQTYQNIELIIIDDGSSDASTRVIEGLLDACERRFVRFCYIARENRGLSRTLNQALEWSKGKFFSALASDDRILPEKTAFLVSYLEKQPECVAAFGSIYLIDDDGVRGAARIRSGKYGFKEVITLKAELPAVSGMLRPDKLLAVGGFNVNTRVEDWDMWLKLTCASGEYLEALPEVVAEYRQHPDNTLKQLDLMYDQQVKILENYSGTAEFSEAEVALRCVRFRNIATSRKAQALSLFLSLMTKPSAYKEIRFYQGIVHLFLKW